MKVYAGAPAAARHYVEADRGRADDYYLSEGTGVARRYTAGPHGPVAELAPLTGDTYEAWVAGRDPETGEPRGRLRTDDRAVRFVEVLVNGPKSWSLAAALHPEIAAAYDAAQDRAATQLIDWLARHATTRVGPAGGQVQVPVERLEAVTVAHYTSRAGDPHRHLHLQINVHVFAGGKWRGLHTVGVRDSLNAINGIGHAAVACDPQFRTALAAHGLTVDATGEIRELAECVGPFSGRVTQIGRNVDRYESEWTAAHPGERPGPALRRAWDARAWAEDRPDKVTPRPGEDLTARWLGELAALAYRHHDVPVGLTPTPVGALDREQAVEVVLARLAAACSAWNPADIRGEVEQLLAAAGIITDPAVRIELAEDLTARALNRCVPLLARDGAPVAVPEHIRAWTSQPVLDVEADLTARLAARATGPGFGIPDTTVPIPRPPDGDLTVDPDPDLTPPARLTATVQRLDRGQAAAATALTGDRSLVVIEGAAGAGKTTTLAAARDLLEVSGRRLVVVTPTLKAAKVAAAEVGTAAGSAAWLVFQHGWRWNGDGAWTRLAIGQADSVSGREYTGPAEGARLRPGDLLVVDEAGMLDQDTARALLSVADEYQVRVALLGDRHQLTAVGRGGVLDLAAAQVDPAAHLTLAGVHRFTRVSADGTVPDTGYADLTLAMRTGDDPGSVFDALCARGQIRLHPDVAALRDAVAAIATTSHAAGESVALVVDTREQAADLNAAIRDRLVADGRVDDTRVVTTGAGQRIGNGDRIATRRNDHDLDVANRDTWTVTAIGRRGGLLVTPTDRVPGAVTPTGGDVTPTVVTPAGVVPVPVTPAGLRDRVLPADYVAEHVELAYASTAHGVQGDTVTTALLVVGEHTGAASAYVGMTRGRTANTAHLIAVDPVEAREQWVAVFARHRADLGPAHAAQHAAAEAARHAPPKPLDQVLAELAEARSVEWGCRQRLAVAEPQRDKLRELLAAGPDPARLLDALTAAHQQTILDAHTARESAEAAGAAVTADADRIRSQLLDAWHAQRGAAATAARTRWEGPGRFGLHRGAVSRAGQQLASWAQGWRPLLPAMPTDPRQIAEIAGRSDYPVRPGESLGAAGRAQAAQAHPERAALAAAAAAAQAAADRAGRAVADARRDLDDRAARFGRLASLPDPAARLADTERDLTAATEELTAARARIAQLTAEPAYRNQPPDQHTAEQHSDQRTGRRGHLDGDRSPHRPVTPPRRVPEPSVRRPRPEDLPCYGPQPGTGRGIGR